MLEQHVALYVAYVELPRSTAAVSCLHAVVSSSRPGPTPAPPLLQAANLCLTALFSLELVLKLLGLGPSTYVADSFNIFDAAVVGISLLELGLAGASGGGGGNAVRSFRSLRVLKSFRVMRLFKMFRWAGGGVKYCRHSGCLPWQHETAMGDCDRVQGVLVERGCLLS